jgi:hypothetical protein
MKTPRGAGIARERRERTRREPDFTIRLIRAEFFALPDFLFDHSFPAFPCDPGASTGFSWLNAENKAIYRTCGCMWR